MSSLITESYVQQFGANIFHLSQQKGSKLRETVRQETQKGESAFYDRIGTVAAIKKVGRHSTTPQLDTPHSRRMVTLVDYEWADLIDDADKIRSLNDPTNDYVMAAMWAMGRSIDDEIILALGGNAYSGQKGTVAVALPNAQMYSANNGSAFTDLNVKTLRALKRIFDNNDVEDNDRYIACAPSQIESLLGQVEVTSSDYNSVKALVQGDVNSFMGFTFKRLTRLPTVASGSGIVASPTTGVVGSGSSVDGFRQAYAYCKMGVLLAVGADITSRVSERDDKSYSTQAYAKMTIGATRMEEAKVIQVFCKEG